METNLKGEMYKQIRFLVQEHFWQMERESDIPGFSQEIYKWKCALPKKLIWSVQRDVKYKTPDNINTLFQTQHTFFILPELCSVIVLPELCLVRDYVITHSVRSM